MNPPGPATPIVPGETPGPPVRPWGFWVTLAFSGAIVGVFLGVQMVTLVGVAVVRLMQGGAMDEAALEALAANGLFWAVATILSTPAGVALTWLFASLRRGLKARDYLHLHRVPARALLRWTIALLAMMLATDAAAHFSGRPIVPEVLVDVYRTAVWPPLLWIAVIVLAPMGEEVFFRGFLFEGLLHSRLGSHFTVFLTSLAWAGTHLQYDLFGMGIIFLGGIVFGYARLRTGSIWTTIYLHALMNFLSTIQVASLVWFLDQPVK